MRPVAKLLWPIVLWLLTNLRVGRALRLTGKAGRQPSGASCSRPTSCRCEARCRTALHGCCLLDCVPVTTTTTTRSQPQTPASAWSAALRARVCVYANWLIMVLRLTRHKIEIGHLRDALPGQSLGWQYRGN